MYASNRQQTSTLASLARLENELLINKLDGCFSECWFVVGCSEEQPEAAQPEIRELRKTVRSMLLLQCSSLKQSAPPRLEDATLPLYEESNGVLTPTGQTWTAQADAE